MYHAILKSDDELSIAKVRADGQDVATAGCSRLLSLVNVNERQELGVLFIRPPIWQSSLESRDTNTTMDIFHA